MDTGGKRVAANTVSRFTNLSLRCRLNALDLPFAVDGCLFISVRRMVLSDNNNSIDCRLYMEYHLGICSPYAHSRYKAVADSGAS